MLKFLGFLVVMGLVFGIGVYVGSQGPDTVLHKAKQLGAEVMAKTGSVERNLALRMSLVTAKDRLVQAKSDLLDKNYGKAIAALDEAAQALTSAKQSADAELREKFEKAAAKVSAIKTDAQAMKAGLQTKVDETVKELDQLLQK
jgi:type I site-specific restriction endonuclease